MCEGGGSAPKAAITGGRAEKGQGPCRFNNQLINTLGA
jgi:hypothetical protein